MLTCLEVKYGVLNSFKIIYVEGENLGAKSEAWIKKKIDHLFVMFEARNEYMGFHYTVFHDFDLKFPKFYGI